MERITLSIPSLYADHHVKNVRKALSAIPGVSNVIASAMYRDVTVDFDPATTSGALIQQAVESAGYPIGVEPQWPVLIESKHDGSPWYTIQRRSAVTIMLDREMSVDFRKY